MLKRTGALEEQLYNPKPPEPSATNIKGIDIGDTNSKISSSTHSKKYDHEGNIINRPKNTLMINLLTLNMPKTYKKI
jgi:hypothetical protein